MNSPALDALASELTLLAPYAVPQTRQMQTNVRAACSLLRDRWGARLVPVAATMPAYRSQIASRCLDLLDAIDAVISLRGKRREVFTVLQTTLRREAQRPVLLAPMPLAS